MDFPVSNTEAGLLFANMSGPTLAKTRRVANGLKVRVTHGELETSIIRNMIGGDRCERRVKGEVDEQIGENHLLDGVQ